MALPAYLRERSAALENGMRKARGLREYAVKRKGQMANDDVDAGVIHDVIQRLRNARDLLDNARSIPGFWDYAQGEYEAMTGDATLDVKTEFDAVLTDIDAAKSAAIDTLPTDANGYLLDRTLNDDGTTSKRMFSSSETSVLRDRLNALADRIDATA